MAFHLNFSGLWGWLHSGLVLLDSPPRPEGWRDVKWRNGARGHLWEGTPGGRLLILLHGYGGSGDSSYISSLAGSLLGSRGIRERGDSILALDAPGTRRSWRTENFWGSGTADQGRGDPLLEDLEEALGWVPSQIALVGFSAGGGWGLAWWCRSELARARIGQWFFVSPTIQHRIMLRGARALPGLVRNWISLCHTGSLLRHRFLHGKWREIPHILLHCSFDILYANVYGTGRSKTLYDHVPPEDGSILNGLAIMAEDDPITHFSLMKEYEKWCEVITFKSGGHCGFFDWDGSRIHEKLIIDRLLKE